MCWYSIDLFLLRIWFLPMDLSNLSKFLGWSLVQFWNWTLFLCLFFLYFPRFLLFLHWCNAFFFLSIFFPIMKNECFYLQNLRYRWCGISMAVKYFLFMRWNLMWNGWENIHHSPSSFICFKKTNLWHSHLVQASLPSLERKQCKMSFLFKFILL